MAGALFSCLCLFFMSSCIQKTDFQIAGDGISQVVIYGKITDGEGPHHLTISRTRTDRLAKPNPIPGATATLNDGLGNTWTYEHLGAERYALPRGMVRGQIGRSYWLEVELPDGTVFHSAPESIQPVPQMDSCYFTIGEESFLSQTGFAISDWFINVFIDTPVLIGGEGAYLRWEMENSYQLTQLAFNQSDTASMLVCYLSEIMDEQDIRIFNAEKASVSRLNGQLVGKKKLGHTFFEKQFYNVYQHSMTRPAAEYYQRLKEVANPAGSIFDAPPAAVKGNISDRGQPEVFALGYFEANAVDTIRTYTENEDMPIFIQPRCVLGLSDTLGPCFDCIQFEGATYEPPEYWCL